MTEAHRQDDKKAAEIESEELKMWEQEKRAAKKFIKIFAVFAVIIVALSVFFIIKRKVNMALNPYLYVDGSGSAGTFGYIYFEDENIVAAKGRKKDFFSSSVRIYLKGLSEGETDVYIFVFNGGRVLDEVVQFKVHNYGTWMQVMRIEVFSIDDIIDLEPEWFTRFLKKGMKPDKKEYSESDFTDELFVNRF